MNAPEESMEKEDNGGTKAGELPRTGGSGGGTILALGAGALIVGGGLLFRKMIR